MITIPQVIKMMHDDGCTCPAATVWRDSLLLPDGDVVQRFLHPAPCPFGPDYTVVYSIEQDGRI